MDWQTDEKMPCVPVEFDVWLTDGSVRRVKCAQSFIGGTIQFMDCTHPAQNAYCAPLRVVGWRVAGNHLTQPPNL